ncbi:probable protein phosphatase 2C 45 [Miscanthus floridulus]|uniref:probable protein phosphatase 2C 45 n=1 Tax=Miscanthus floridulus TaxID=154761 RepID=UPI003458A8DD
MREEGPWGPPAPPPSARLSLSLSLVVLLLSLLLPGRAVSCSSSCWCQDRGQGREAVAEVARMGLVGDGSADTAHLSNSENGRFSYGVASSPGKRASMEDFYEARIDDVDGEKVGMFGVYDGHGGVRAAEYVKQHLFSNLIKHPKFITDTKAAIAETYNHTDSEFLKADSSQTRDAGSTASTAIIVGDRLLVANVGDSRAVISKGGQAIAVSRDHKPDQTDERQRIEDAGGFVMWAGTWRVGGVLAVSRAFGDKLLKQYVVADPEIKEEVVDSSLEFLILASDGLWDVVTNEEAVAMVKPIQDPQEAANKLLEEASRRGSSDNITVVIVSFLDGTTTTGDKSGEDKETTNDQNS